MRLSVENLTLIRNDKRLISGLNFSLDAGEALLLTGPNGSGKTSLLRALLGFLHPADGTITLEPGPAPLPEQAHFLGMQDALKPALTAAENLTFWAAMLNGTTSPREALAALDLAALEHVPVAYMSAGQRRRVALARLMLANRPLWLLDEPANALDQATRARFAALCAAHRQSGGMIIAATHIDIDLPDTRILNLGKAP